VFCWNSSLPDEFDGVALDTEKWWDHNPGWLGRQPGFFYTGNVTVSDGKMHLAMRKEEPPEMPKDQGYHTYTSAAVRSKDTVRYGYFEVKAKAMASAGSSSFWFYHADPAWWTEIDVFEIGGRAPGYERALNMTLHVMQTPAEKRHISAGGKFIVPASLADDYHVYGLEWDETNLKFYFDGVLVRRSPNTHWHQPLELNFDSETMPEWFGLPKDEDLPSTYSVEYVRAWKKR
jgi:beta-glucanase (GH16 family)